MGPGNDSRGDDGRPLKAEELGPNRWEADGMSAVIRVRMPSGTLRTFQAERVEIDNGLVTAVGRWRDDRRRRRRAYTWPRRQLVEIAWASEAVIA